MISLSVQVQCNLNRSVAENILESNCKNNRVRFLSISVIFDIFHFITRFCSDSSLKNSIPLRGMKTRARKIIRLIQSVAFSYTCLNILLSTTLIVADPIGKSMERRSCYVHDFVNYTCYALY